MGNAGSSSSPSGTLLEYKATGIGIGRPAAMKVFEEEYNAEAPVKDAILLGLKALHSATEGKFDVDTVEIGVIGKEKPHRGGTDVSNAHNRAEAKNLT